MYPVRIFKLIFDLSSHDVHLHTDPFLTKFVHQLQACRLRIIAHDCDEHICSCRLRDLCSACLHSQKQAFLAKTETNTRSFRSADFFHKMVVSSSAAYSALCTDFCRYEFKRRLGVVVQSANDPRIYHVFDPHRIQVCLQIIEGILAVIAQIIQHHRRSLHQFLAHWRFTV